MIFDYKRQLTIAQAIRTINRVVGKSNAIAHAISEMMIKSLILFIDLHTPQFSHLHSVTGSSFLHNSIRIIICPLSWL